jgi:hypothetical protein
VRSDPACSLSLQIRIFTAPGRRWILVLLWTQDHDLPTFQAQRQASRADKTVRRTAGVAPVRQKTGLIRWIPLRPLIIQEIGNLGYLQIEQEFQFVLSNFNYNIEAIQLGGLE